MGMTEAAALIVGIVMPLLVSVLKQVGLDRRWNLVIALAACAGVGVLTAYASGAFTGQAVIVSIALVFSAAQAAYQLFWRGTGIDTWLTSKGNIGKPATSD